MIRSGVVQGDAGAALVLLLVIGLLACGGQRSPRGQTGDRAVTLPDSAGGWLAAEEASRYDTESIYSYIDGHAEVYLAYGMRSCRALRYAGPEGEPDIVLDLFEMASPADAFGVYTHDRDGEEVGIGRDSVFRSGWLSFWQGSHYVSVYAEGESDAAREAVLELGRAVAATIADEGEPPSIVAALPADGLEPRSVCYLRSSQILNSHLWVSDRDLFLLGPGTEAVLGRYEHVAGAGHLLLVDYDDSATAERALGLFSAEFPSVAGGNEAAKGEGGWYGVARVGDLIAFALAAESDRTVTELLAAVTGGAE